MALEYNRYSCLLEEQGPAGASVHPNFMEKSLTRGRVGDENGVGLLLQQFSMFVLTDPLVLLSCRPQQTKNSVYTTAVHCRRLARGQLDVSLFSPGIT